MKGRVHLVLGALLALALATPALAAGPTGYFVALEAKFLQPSNLKTGYVLNDPVDDFVPSGTLEDVEFDDEVSAKLWFGQSFGNSGWAVSYWSYDEEASDSRAAASGGELWTTLHHPAEIFFPVTGPSSARVGLEADTIDAFYWRRVVDDEKMHLSWYSGLRHATLDYGLRVAYDDFGDLFTANYISEAEGLGMIGGLRGSMRVGEGWYVNGNIGYSYMMGDIDSSTTMTSDFDFVFSTLDVAKEEDRSMSTLDLGCSVSWHVTDRWMLSLGYEFSRWENVVDRTLFVDDFNLTQVAHETFDVNWDGFTISAGVIF
ncbi:MAG: Lpg1974 family pore-forming outer membrane protein [Acidobacteriota bacterium]|nr:Lpg1974 family pore-forming outer membrane protein [Acidobacteriota bacterium]